MTAGGGGGKLGLYRKNNDYNDEYNWHHDTNLPLCVLQAERAVEAVDLAGAEVL